MKNTGTNRKIVRRYNIERNLWEVGYYANNHFWIIRYDPLSLSEDVMEESKAG